MVSKQYIPTTTTKSLTLLSVAKFDRFEDLEDQVMDYLASVTDLKVFGCSIEFLQTATHTYLEDPIWDKLQQGREFTIIFKNCSVALPAQEQLGGCPIDQVPQAVYVPINPEEIVPEWAFAGVPRLRHVSVESGIRLIGAEAWQNCRQLRIVKLPASVVGISDNAFWDCKLLNSVLAPGVGILGTKPLRSAVPCNGCMHRMGLQTFSIVKPSLGNTSSKGASTLLRSPGVSLLPPEGQHSTLGPVSQHRVVLAPRESIHLLSQSTSQPSERTCATVVDCSRV